MLFIVVTLKNGLLSVEQRIEDLDGGQIVMASNGLNLVFEGDIAEAIEVFQHAFLPCNNTAGRTHLDVWAVTQVAQWVKQKAAAAADTAVPAPRRQYWDGVT